MVKVSIPVPERESRVGLVLITKPVGEKPNQLFLPKEKKGN
jgi:hypothetical protein